MCVLWHFKAQTPCFRWFPLSRNTVDTLTSWFTHARQHWGSFVTRFTDKSPEPKQSFSSAPSWVWRPSLATSPDHRPPFFHTTLSVALGACPLILPLVIHSWLHQWILKMKHPPWTSPHWAGSSWARFCERIWVQAVLLFHSLTHSLGCFYVFTWKVPKNIKTESRISHYPLKK